MVIQEQRRGDDEHDEREDQDPAEKDISNDCGKKCEPAPHHDVEDQWSNKLPQAPFAVSVVGRAAKTRRSEVELQRRAHEDAPLLVVDAHLLPPPSPHHARSSAARNSAVRPVASRTPVSVLNAASSVPVPVVREISSRGAFDDLAPPVDDDNPRTHALDHLENVRAEQDGLPLRGQPPEQFLHDQRGVGIEAGERLVQEQDVRPVNQGGSQHHLLLHALRVFGDALVPVRR